MAIPSPSQESTEAPLTRSRIGAVDSDPIRREREEGRTDEVRLPRVPFPGVGGVPLIADDEEVLQRMVLRVRADARDRLRDAVWGW